MGFLRPSWTGTLSRDIQFASGTLDTLEHWNILVRGDAKPKAVSCTHVCLFSASCPALHCTLHQKRKLSQTLQEYPRLPRACLYHHAFPFSPAPPTELLLYSISSCLIFPLSLLCAPPHHHTLTSIPIPFTFHISE